MALLFLLPLLSKLREEELKKELDEAEKDICNLTAKLAKTETSFIESQVSP